MKNTIIQEQDLRKLSYGRKYKIYKPGTYKYKTIYGWTLIDNNIALVKDALEIDWYGDGWWRARHKFGYSLCTRYSLGVYLDVLLKDMKYIHFYEKGVYAYRNDNGSTLIEHGEMIFTDVNCLHWYSKDVYKCKPTASDGYYLVEHGIKVVENATEIHWFDDGVYSFKTKDGHTLIEQDITLVENAVFCWWTGYGSYCYKIDKLYTHVRNYKIVADNLKKLLPSNSEILQT